MKILIENKDKRNIINLDVSNVCEVESFIYGGIQERNSIWIKNKQNEFISIQICTVNLPQDVDFSDLYDCFKLALANQQLNITLELTNYKNWRDSISKIK